MRLTGMFRSQFNVLSKYLQIWGFINLHKSFLYMIDSRSRRMDPWRAPIFSEFKYNLPGRQEMKRSENAKNLQKEDQKKYRKKKQI